MSKVLFALILLSAPVYAVENTYLARCELGDDSQYPNAGKPGGHYMTSCSEVSADDVDVFNAFAVRCDRLAADNPDLDIHFVTESCPDVNRVPGFCSGQIKFEEGIAQQVTYYHPETFPVGNAAARCERYGGTWMDNAL